MTGIRTRPESLGLGMLLSAVGGYLDAYTFVTHGVFSNAQTGNLVLIAVSASARHWAAAAIRLPAVAAFAVGIVVVELLTTQRRRLHRPLRYAVGAEVVLLAVVATLPDSAPAALITVTVSFVAAIQFASFRTLVDAPYTTLMTTGNLRSLISAATRWFAGHDPALARQARRFAGVVAAFAAGALIGALTTRHLHVTAAAIPSAALALVLVWLIVETRGIERAATSTGDDAAGTGR